VAQLAHRLDAADSAIDKVFHFVRRLNRRGDLIDIAAPIAARYRRLQAREQPILVFTSVAITTRIKTTRARRAPARWDFSFVSIAGAPCGLCARLNGVLLRLLPGQMSDGLDYRAV
jgi:hypothetical protein